MKNDVNKSMGNPVCRRLMSGKTRLRLVDIWGLHLEIISQIVMWYENSFRVDCVNYMKKDTLTQKLSIKNILVKFK